MADPAPALQVLDLGRHHRYAGAGAAVLGWLAVNLLFGAAERESVHHPPNWPDFFAGVVLALGAVPLLVVALRGGRPAKVLGWIGVGMVAFAAFAAVGIVAQSRT